MTEGQVKYQTLMENKRHNLQMERFGEEEAHAKTVQAESSYLQAKVAKDKAYSEKYKNFAGSFENVTHGVSNVFSAANTLLGMIGSAAKLAMLFA